MYKRAFRRMLPTASTCGTALALVGRVMSRLTVPVDPGISNDAKAVPRLGELLVAEGLLTPTQLQEALRIQRASDNCPPLGHILIAQKVVTHDQLLSVLEQHRRSSKLGDILLKDREINRAQLKTALREQHRTQRPLGEVLLELGYISEERLRLALCRQLHIRFYNLDSVTLDPTVRDLVSETFATKHRIVPVSRIGTLLILAMDDPTQSRVIDDVAATVGLRIEVVTS